LERNKDIKTNLIRDLEKTGYPVELLAGDAFARAGWTVDYNVYYTDWDEGKGREIDLVVCNGVSSKKNKVGVTLYLVSEVKKSENPWVIFTASSVGESAGLEEPCWGRLHVASDEIDPDVLPADKIRARSTIHKFQRYGHSYYIAFAGLQSKPTIFEALTSSVKASEDLLRGFNESIRQEEERTGFFQKKGRWLWLIEPMVILDGLLYEAYLDRHNRLVIDRVNHIPVCFGYVSPQYRRAEFSVGYVVEIVTMDALPELISKKMKWLESMKRTIVSNISKRVS
jgi:hypothetical protein